MYTCFLARLIYTKLKIFKKKKDFILYNIFSKQANDKHILNLFICFFVNLFAALSTNANKCHSFGLVLMSHIKLRNTFQAITYS